MINNVNLLFLFQVKTHRRKHLVPAECLRSKERKCLWESMLSNWAHQKMTRNPISANDVESFWNGTLYPTAGHERVGAYLRPSAREPVQTHTAPRNPLPANHQNKRRQNTCVLRTGNGEILTKYHKTSFGRDTAISMIEIAIRMLMLNVRWLVLTVSVFGILFSFRFSSLSQV